MESDKLKITVEDKIPYIRNLLEPYGEVVYLPAEQITQESIIDTDALIIRTRNICDKSLLQKSRCSFIASATIGLDHVDRDYCESRGIKVINAPGCNASAVAQYVLCSILTLIPKPSGLTLGIIGVGHIGSIVARWSEALGMRVLLNDPPRARKEGDSNFVPIERIAEEADIITFHTPLVKEGQDRTYHLLNDKFVDRLKKKPLIINAARGPVTDTSALIEGIENGKIGQLVIDCWENEPSINKTLLARAAITTPHIAGYSIEGKLRATKMAVDGLTAHFGLPPVAWNHELKSIPQSLTKEELLHSYNPLLDTQALKSNPSSFEHLRNHYNYR